MGKFSRYDIGGKPRETLSRKPKVSTPPISKVPIGTKPSPGNPKKKGIKGIIKLMKGGGYGK